jgi:hypothetical protein
MVEWLTSLEPFRECVVVVDLSRAKNHHRGDHDVHADRADESLETVELAQKRPPAKNRAVIVMRCR